MYSTKIPLTRQPIRACHNLIFLSDTTKNTQSPTHSKMPSFLATILTTSAMLLMSAARVESTQKTMPLSSCQLQIQLDQHPADTSWEIRGPFPAVDLVASRDYDYYQTPDALELESVELVEGGTYHLIFTDYANGGIDDGHFILTQQVVKEDSSNVDTNTVARQNILVQDDGRFGAGQVYTFEVPIRPSSSSSVLRSLGRTLSLLSRA
jgi:hypothetical protein